MTLHYLLLLICYSFYYSYIDVPVKQTALAVDTVTLGTETMYDEFVISDNGRQHTTSLLESNNDDDDDDFQYRGAV